MDDTRSRRLGCTRTYPIAFLRLELENPTLRARTRDAGVRRLSLPRSLLARLVDAVVRDRASAIEESGQAVVVTQLFEQHLTPRNTVLFASLQRKRLPPLRAE